MATQTRRPYSPFVQALIIQVRVLGALILREMRVRYGRSHFGYFWALAEPVGFVVMLSIVFSFGGRQAAYGPSLPLFFALGVLPLKLFMATARQLTGAVLSNQSLLTYPIVRELDTVLARFILELLTTVVVLVICLIGIWIIDDIPPPSHPLRMMQGLLLIMMLGFGVGLTNVCIVRKFASWQNIFAILTAPMLFISGVFYSLNSLPSDARALLVWNPLIHGVEIVRDGYYSNYRTPAVSEEYIFGVGLACVVIGLFCERFYRAR